MTQDLPPRAAGTRAAGRRLRSDAARNVELLVTAARALFDERGTEVALDEIARRAGVGNATLYRNFPTRGDLLVAVYSEEVDALCGHGAALLETTPPGDALFAWLDLFVVHAATRRALALAAISQGPDERRGELAEGWHASMRSTLAALLAPAQEAGAVRPDLTAADLLALTNATALASTDPADAVRLMHVLRGGVEPRPDLPP
ncbi:TetR/AcrR family transcriptional regulator [Frankia sp. AvcI1]|uniref:TetR/AcrR family transcriptional regulator n=1 Tax=Frankia sp. AvcI1 TaxID=573496 RepID=UPI0006EBF07B|nr:TetR/AcrR family transcriptional regulator [Frankia sp. AvcI1]